MVSERVAVAAEGNPLYVEEMVAMLIDDGFLAREDDRWIAVGRSFGGDGCRRPSRP